MTDIADPPCMANGVEIELPPEPPQTSKIVIEATKDGGMVFAFAVDHRVDRQLGDRVWCEYHGGRPYVAWRWRDIVNQAMKDGWRLHVYLKGGDVLTADALDRLVEHIDNPHGACGAGPYEDDGEPD